MATRCGKRALPQPPEPALRCRSRRRIGPAAAAEAGITNSLIIARVNDVSPAGMNLADVANLIHGPVGTKVKLELVTPDHSQTNTVELTRRKLQL